MEGRYRKISNGIDSVDETLFGTGSGRNSRGSNKSKASEQRKTVTGFMGGSAVVISKSELERIRNEAQMKTDVELEEERKRAEAIRAEKERVARERKIRMRELEKNAEKHMRKSDEEIARQAREDAIRQMANAKRDEESDVAKLLTSMASRAIAFTIRDQQLEEKKKREELEAEYDRRMDVLMELDRIKDIQRREDEERYKVSKRLEDRQVIIDQIQERERQKLIALDAKEQENVAMKMAMKRYEDDDRVKAERRKVEIEKSRLEVIRANEDAIQRKKHAALAARKEIEDMLIYQAQKDAELLKREQEEAAIEKLKKERQAKLLAESERSASNAGKADEIRARRAAEEYERRMRMKEKEDAARKKAEIVELVRARKIQAEDKKNRLEHQKLAQEEEYRNALMYTAKMAEREERERQSKIDAVNHYRDMLMEQIRTDELLKLKHRRGADEEGSDYHQFLVRETARLTAIRDKMVADLEAKGVSGRYLSEMKNVDIGKILRR